MTVTVTACNQDCQHFHPSPLTFSAVVVVQTVNVVQVVNPAVDAIVQLVNANVLGVHVDVHVVLIVNKMKINYF
ncbi:hypothetical protein EWB00_004620 [Schistosoma japonicum]|uniref:Uncharacterized protein n=1 Tax=Schistosoma japonicum TaxID=6182 RepID=A0A4Z2D4M2_SCHJA|nr:hypothetical protein KSF78_0001266 [Schistosoma japonicum]TNN11398.1 hypothetical protein EWB00_004620 [Schistosoma japonicum]